MSFRFHFYLSLFVLMLSGMASLTCYGQSSVLSTGKWFKLGVEKHGVYKITYDQMKKMGLDPDNIDPRNIRMYGQEGGVLPQPNSATRPGNLVEIAIDVAGQNDGTFNREDFILFYAQGPNRIGYNTQKNIIAFEANLYSNKNFYFITTAPAPGKRVGTSGNLAGNFPAVSTFEDFLYHEPDAHNELGSGREWFSKSFEVEVEQSFEFDVEGITPNTPVRFVSDVMAQSFNPSSFAIFFNDNNIATQPVATIPSSQYGIKGRHRRDTIEVSTDQVGAAGVVKQQIKYQFQKAAASSSIGYLDFFLVHFTRDLALYGTHTLFRSASSLAYPTVQYQVGKGATGTIWDVTNPYDPLNQQFDGSSGTAIFSTTSTTLKEFAVFTQPLTPTLEGEVANQNLHGLPTPDVIIVTHPLFRLEAERLGRHRQAHNGWVVSVVTTDEVYNEFSSGRQDVSAIRDFVRHVYSKNPSVLKSLLLFGKGSYDYKDRIKNNTNFVPIYQSRNSLSPLETYSSDDYYGFLDDHEGIWLEGSFPDDHTLDIGVGRLPVKTLEEAATIVDKIINYDANAKNFGRWRKDIVFVADDGSISDGFSSIHQLQANTLATMIESGNPEFDTRKIFLGTYQKVPAANGESIPAANEDIIEDFERGTLIVNFTGHGSEKVWTDERVFTDNDIITLENKLLPFLVTATCEFGRHDDPLEISSAEMVVLQKKAGSIGLVTTTRPVNSSTNFALNQAFYQALFQKDANRYLSLGEVFRKTKNTSMSGVANRNFSLLADPSMTLAMPSYSVIATNIVTATGSDILKALSTVTVTGEVRDPAGNLAADFNGIVEAKLFDKPTQFVTVGRNNPPFQYEQWYNPLFRGRATVKDGKFEFQFIVPKNIAYEIGPGKMSFYAFDEKKFADAAGHSSAFQIGGSEANPDADNNAPAIDLFMEDITFEEGGVVNPNTMLVARVTDDSGINISNYGIGNTMMAVLDDDQKVYILNEYYVADTDDFTRGWIHYPIRGLAPGRHTLTVKVWDTHNNPAEKTISFIVTDGKRLVIEDFGNYPNPVQSGTTVFFQHNRAGDDLEGQVSFYTYQGQHLKTVPFSIANSPYRVDVLEMDTDGDFEKKLHNGLYFVRLAVRSLSNGSKNERVAKFVIAK